MLVPLKRRRAWLTSLCVHANVGFIQGCSLAEVFLTDWRESLRKPNNAKAPLLTRRLLKLHTSIRKWCPWFNFCCEFVGRVTGIDDLSKQWSEWTSAALQMMKDFSGLALPPLFGEHILEAELEPGGVELGPGEVTLSLTSVRESFPLLQSH